MKTKLITTLGIFLLVATLVTAGIISTRDREVERPQPQKDALDSIDLNDYNVTDYSIGVDFIERCLNKIKIVEFDCSTSYFNVSSNKTIVEPKTCEREDNVLNDCKRFNITGLSEVEKYKKLDAWEDKRVGDIANATIDRNNQPEKVEEGSGTTTTTNKK